MSCYNSPTFENASDFQLHLIQKVLGERASNNDTHIELVYTNIKPSWAVDTVNVLQRRLVGFTNQINPLHSAAQEWLSRSQQAWLSTDVLTLNERNRLIITSNSLFRFSNGPWADTIKSPDITVQLSTSGLPRVTFECGFPESHDILQHDMVGWLMGGDGAVQAVVLVMFLVLITRFYERLHRC